MPQPRRGDLFLGRYEILDLLGLGGMGSVHLALDRQSGAEVALKVLNESAASDEALVRRFDREIETLRRIDHPDILQYLDHGLHEGAPFLVLELVAGKTLAEAAPEFHARADSVLLLGARLSRAFAAAHAKGIIHRDIKPGNIKFTSGGEPRILDYGLARWVVPEGMTAEEMQTIDKMTATNAVLGTIPYMSPEQIHGERVDHRSDIFSLAVVLYELAAARRPYEGSSLGELLAAMNAANPRPLGEVFPRLRSPAGAALDAILRTALRPAPGERFQSMEELARALERARESALLPPDASIAILLPPAVADASGPLVGRDVELERIGAALDRARASEPVLAVLEGPAGIGKSRLASEIARAAHSEGFLCLTAPARARAPLSQAPIALSQATLAWRPELDWLVQGSEAFPGDAAVNRALHVLGLPTVRGEAKVRDFEHDEAISPEDRSAAAAYPGAATPPTEPGVAGDDIAGGIFRDAFLSLAGRMPLFLLVDDLDRAAAQSLRLLDGLRRALGHRPVFVLAALGSDRVCGADAETAIEALLGAEDGRPANLSERPVSAGPDQVDRGTVSPSATGAGPGGGSDTAVRSGAVPLVHLRLGPLMPADLAAMAREIYPGLDLDSACAERLAARSGGNPAHAREILQRLEEQGSLRRSGIEWSLVSPVEFPFPGKATEQLEMRLAGLAEEDLARLEAAAVAGSSFTSGRVREILGWAESDTLAMGRHSALARERGDKQSAAAPDESKKLAAVPHTEPAKDAALARDERAWAEDLSRRRRLVLRDPNGEMWRFEPPIAREALLRRLSPDRRTLLERAAAHSLASRIDEEADPTLCAEAARHFLEALLEEEALPYAARAGMGFQKRGSSSDALLWLDRARAIVETRIETLEESERQPLRDHLADLELGIGECHHALSDHDKALEHAEKARTLAASAGRDDLQARCLILAARVCVSRGDVLQAQRRGKEAERIARRASLHDQLALALSAQALALSRSGETDEAEELWTEASGIFDSLGRAEEAAEVDFRLGNHYLRLDREDRAEECYTRAAGRLASGGSRFLAASLQNARAALLILQRRPARALPMLEEAVSLFHASGSRHEEARSLHNIAECQYLLGDLEAAHRICSQVIAIRTETGETALRAGDMRNLAHILFDLGEIEQALEKVSEALVIKKQIEERAYIPQCLTLLGEIELELGRNERARGAFNEVMVDFPETREEVFHAKSGLAMADWNAGLVESAEKRFALVLEDLGRIEDPLEGLADRYRILRFLGGRGKPVAAIAEITQREDRELDLLPEARLLKGLIEAVKAEAEDPDRSRSCLLGALDTARQVGRVEWTWRIERDLAALERAESPERATRLAAAAAIIERQASRFRSDELRRAYLAHRERAEVLAISRSLPTIEDRAGS